MRLRFSSGSVTPASRARNRSARARRARAARGSAPPNVSTTCAASSLRSRPWSTKTHVSWSPTALCTSSAATALSTPPERPQRTRSRPDARADPLDLLLDHGGRRPGGRGAGDPVEEVLQDRHPVRGVDDLGMELDRRRGRAPAPRRRRSAWTADPATTVAPRGGATTESRWLIHTVCSPGGLRLVLRALRGALPCRTRRRRCGRPGRRARAPSAACRSRCRASARRARRSPGRRDGAPSA